LLLTTSASCATRFSRDETTSATRKAKCEVATRGKGKTKKKMKKKKKVCSVGSGIRWWAAKDEEYGTPNHLYG
jgi:hypothetical protein